MAGMEIFLIIVGTVTIIGSFVFAGRLESAEKKTGNALDLIDETELQKRINEVVDEILDEKLDTTEAKIDKIMNEKIMTVGEYSDNVISDIDKNHDEVMFLYGMLNDKEKDVKKTLIDVENLKRSINNNEMNEESRRIEESENHIRSEEEVVKEDSAESDAGAFYNHYQDKERGRNTRRSNERKKKNGKNKKPAANDSNDNKDTGTKKEGVALSAKEVQAKSNNNARILNLYRQGKEPIQIAKELKLGMGEVRLVIDLYKNR